MGRHPKQAGSSRLRSALGCNLPANLAPHNGWFQRAKPKCMPHKRKRQTGTALPLMLRPG